MSSESEKYTRLRDMLAVAAKSDKQTIFIDFDEIEKLVDELPSDAYNRKRWWANGRQPQAQAWLGAGWQVDTVGFGLRRVAFKRSV